MTPQQIDLVRASFEQVRPIATTAATLFYRRLFEIDPGVRRLFGGDLAQQGQRLMSMIAAAVALLDQPQRLDLALRELGERHLGYGVQPAHYDAVGAALLDTLALALGAGFDAPLRAAWAAMYTHVASTMQAGVIAAARA